MIHNHSQKDDPLRVVSFPSKLYNLLEDADEQGFSDLIAWQKEGQSFKIHKVEEFSTKIMVSYFSQTKFKSFQRQLNMYGWKKVQVGPNKGGYYHPDFIRGSPDLCRDIVRRRSKFICTSTAKKDLMFQSFTGQVNNSHFESQSGASLCRSNSVQLEETEVASLYEFFYPDDPSERKMIQSVFDDNRSSIQCTLQTHWNDKKNDFSTFHFGSAEIDEFVTILEHHEECGKQRCNEGSDTIQDPVDNCFPYKLHLMLENAERDGYNHIVSWVKGGTAFKVHDTDAFVAQVMPMFFDQSKYESFRRQLNLYQFTRIARGHDRGIISHPHFLEGSRWLCEEIKRARFIGKC